MSIKSAAPTAWHEASCIINPRAASHKWHRKKRLRRYLKQRLPGEAYDSLGSKDKSIQLARELSQTHRLLVVIGGDGTVSDVIQGLVDGGRSGRVRVGLIPFGSGNAFRNSLGIPKSVRRAVRVLTSGRDRPIDVISVNGRVGSFINVGATAQVGYLKHAHNVPGLLGHILASRAFLTWRRRPVDVILEDGLDDRGRPFDRRAVRVSLFDSVVSKTRHFGYGWLVAPRARLDDGYLDITFYEMPGWLYVLLYPLIYFGLLQRRLKHFKARRAVFLGRDLPVQYNGEDLPPQDRVELEVIPRAVRIIVPDG